MADSNQLLNNMLLHAVFAARPDMDHIRLLLDQGADVNARDSVGDSILQRTFQCRYEDPIPLDVVKLLLNSGADVNAEDDTGFNCLWDAALAQHYELVELLIRHGADVNCISLESGDSLLDSVVFDQWYEEAHNPDSMDGGQTLLRIIDLLKSHGAKPVREIFAAGPERAVQLADYYPTGLFTRKGNLLPEDIAGMDVALSESLRKWLSGAPSTKPGDMKSRIETTYPGAGKVYEVALAAHNEEGLSIAKRLRSLLPENVQLAYHFVKADAAALTTSPNYDRLMLPLI